MPILYSVISRATTILAKYAECVGNFAEVTDQILALITLDNHKLTYSHGDYLIHYICENKLIYMCITDEVIVEWNDYHNTSEELIHGIIWRILNDPEPSCF